MKKTISVLILLMSGLILSSHVNAVQNKQKTVIKTDNTFNFTVTDATNYIDSKTGTYTRKYLRFTKSVHFNFTESETKKIKELYFGEKLNMLPNKYRPNCKICSMPNFDEKFEFYFKGIQKDFIYNDDFCCTDENSKTILNKMKNLRDYIYNIVFDINEVKQLEPSDFMFL